MAYWMTHLRVAEALLRLLPQDISLPNYYAGAIAPAMMIASTCHFTEAQETAIIQVALILTALDTFLQQFPLFGRIGSNLPILTGVSFAFLPAFQAIGFEFGFGTLLGAELVGGAGAAAPDIAHATLYRARRRIGGKWSPAFRGGRLIKSTADLGGLAAFWA